MQVMPASLLYSRQKPSIGEMPRFFSLFEAERLLPEVEGLLRSLLQLKEDYQRTETELNRLLQRIAITGGMIPPRDKISQFRNRKDAAARGLQTSLKKLEEIGCLLKDIDTGLVDFPTLYRGKEVYLCWKLGETNIAYWHHVEAGYPGRRAIDSEFIAQHRGDS
jgi:hypothetical protein